MVEFIPLLMFGVICLVLLAGFPVAFSLAGILDSVTSINFQINSLWNDTFEKVMLAVVFSFFGGRTFEKGANIITGNKK